MKTKLSIGIFTTLYNRSFKSMQFTESILSFYELGILEKIYIVPSRQSIKKKKEYISQSYLLWCALVLLRISGLNRLFPRYNVKRLHRFLFYHFYSKKILKDKSDFVLVSPIPLGIIKRIHGKKKIILEYDSMHPFTCRDLVREENERLGISEVLSSFTDVKSVKLLAEAIYLADVIIVLSEYAKETFVNNGVDESRLRIVNKPIFSNLYPPIRYKSKLKYSFFYIAHANSVIKGVHRFIEAWKHFKNLNPLDESYLFIIGSDSLASVHRTDNENKFNIIFTGTLNYDEIYSFMTKCNPIGVLTSLVEGCPRVIKEFISLNIPCIVSKAATCDLVEDTINGFVVDPLDFDHTTEVIKKMKSPLIYQTFIKTISSQNRLIHKKNYANQIQSIMEEFS